ncbi:hypothetical protein BRD00_03745 [Halobacteriales archaeon QS_8_69_26]|nr:MAG: hypothetical protein BRD00_03745 [Halobacteriales archaeon QS_8_69_26]
MDGRVTRRDVLRGGCAVITGVVVPGTADAGASNGEFDPVENGVGFPNWHSASQDFEAPPDPSRESIARRIRRDWQQSAAAVVGLDTDALPGRSLEPSRRTCARRSSSGRAPTDTVTGWC